VTPQNIVVTRTAGGHSPWFECGPHAVYKGYRGWSLTRPGHKPLSLTQGEEVAGDFEDNVQLDRRNENFHVSVPIDVPAWVGAYSCVVQAPDNVYGEVRAALTMIGK
jgi:hypothetical protein